MKLKILNVKENGKDVIFKVQLDKSEFVKLCEKTQKEVAKDYKVPGFRKGFVPKAILAKYVSDEDIKKFCLSKDSFQNDFVNQVVVTQEFEKSRSMQFLNNFKILDIDDSNGPIIEAYFDAMPKIVNLNDLNLKKVVLPKFNVTKKSVDDIKKELKPLLKKEAVIADKKNKVIENNDIAVIDFKGFIDNKPFVGGEAKNYELEIGSKSFIDNFEDQLIGLKPKDKKDVFVSFPKDYHSKDYAGKKAKFEVTVNDVKTISYPKIDKKFINETLKITRSDIDNEQKLISFFQTVEYENSYNAYCEQCYKIFCETLRKQAKFSHESQGLLKFYYNNIVSMYEKQLQQQGYQSLQQYITLVGKSNKNFGEKIDNEIKKQAKDAIANNLIFNAMVEKFKIECTKQDFDNFYNKYLKITTSNSDEFKKEFNKAENKTYYENLILKDKFFDKMLKVCALKE